MKINHNDAVVLEHLVSDLYNCHQGAMGGIINAGHFEYHPYHAALICISKLYGGEHDEQIDRFACTWETVFDYPDENKEYTFKQYIDALRELVQILK